MSPEVNDSFMDASVLEEQARKKGSLDPLEVDAVFTRSDPHIVQSSLHAGKLTRITPLQSGQVVSGVEMATAKTFPSWFQPASVSQVELDSISRIFGHDAVGEEGIARYIDKRRKILGGETLEPSDYNTAVWSVLRHLDVIGGSLREERRVPEVDTKKRGVDFCWGCGKDLQKVGNRTAFAVSIPTLSGHGDVLAVCRECAATGKTPDGRVTRLDGTAIRPPTEGEVTKIGAALAERSAAGVIVLADELKRTPEECLVIAARESFEKFDSAHVKDTLVGSDNPLMRLLGLLCAIVHPVVASSGARYAIKYIAERRKKGEDIDLCGKEILDACLNGAQEKAREMTTSANAISRRLSDVLQARVSLAEQRVAWGESLDTAVVGEARLSQGVGQAKANVQRLETEMKNAILKKEEEDAKTVEEKQEVKISQEENT
ncbi:hypothetical protein FOZ63_031741 [Perkinsus olseni]|uniref:Uncharacterized protein n=1 Tax=Perkinsus olseni TaxID=32597 RepID=A0A7J6UCS6_PEROL|nr:hypothetical protein FOZ63_031741 [Perkinsus olseni]